MANATLTGTVEGVNQIQAANWPGGKALQVRILRSDNTTDNILVDPTDAASWPFGATVTYTIAAALAS